MKKVSCLIWKFDAQCSPKNKFQYLFAIFFQDMERICNKNL